MLMFMDMVNVVKGVYPYKILSAPHSAPYTRLSMLDVLLLSKPIVIYIKVCTTLDEIIPE